MCNLKLMKNGEAFKQLTGDFSDIDGGSRTRHFQVIAQVAMLNVFHSDENTIAVFVPAEELDEEVIILLIISTTASCNVTSTHISHFGQNRNFAGVINLSDPLQDLLNSSHFSAI